MPGAGCQIPDARDSGLSQVKARRAIAALGRERVRCAQMPTKSGPDDEYCRMTTIPLHGVDDLGRGLLYVLVCRAWVVREEGTKARRHEGTKCCELVRPNGAGTEPGLGGLGEGERVNIPPLVVQGLFDRKLVVRRKGNRIGRVVYVARPGLGLVVEGEEGTEEGRGA